MTERLLVQIEDPADFDSACRGVLSSCLENKGIARRSFHVGNDSADRFL